MTPQPEDLKRFLPLYIGCEVMVTRPESASVQMRLTGISIDDMDSEDEMFSAQVFEGDGPDAYEGKGNILVGEEEVQLILRPLSSMTEDENLTAQEIVSAFDKLLTRSGNARIFNERLRGEFNTIEKDIFKMSQLTIYLLSIGIDLFNLIPSGLAIDKTTMK